MPEHQSTTWPRSVDNLSSELSVGCKGKRCITLSPVTYWEMEGSGSARPASQVAKRLSQVSGCKYRYLPLSPRPPPQPTASVCLCLPSLRKWFWDCNTRAVCLLPGAPEGKCEVAEMVVAEETWQCLTFGKWPHSTAPMLGMQEGSDKALTIAFPCHGSGNTATPMVGRQKVLGPVAHISS